MKGIRCVSRRKSKSCFGVLVISLLLLSAFHFRIFRSYQGYYEFKLEKDSNYISKKGYFDGLPSITLTIRTSSQPRLLPFLYCTALRTAVLYWSQDIGSIGIILDKESNEDVKMAKSLKSHQETMGINFEIYYEALPHDPTIFTRIGRRFPGYNRQIFSSFLLDLFIETDVIAWTDTDGKFTSPVTKDNIVNNGKLRAKGMDTFKYTIGWSQLTERMIGHPMISDFMTYFPVYIWTDTVKNCRKHILKHMNVTSLETAFMKTGPGGDLSPVNVIMTYAYYFEHDKYDWHLDLRRKSLDVYNKKHYIYIIMR
ncbi:hypothetical protein LOTGIDRAFT_154033 [Lottia gigantea]|uniref:Nucleotide-diphospho-sugar transferase domain-containing protein n=1 Tax=Lottia gigantea TaxID=225164 RepID=V4BK72_LOTGI|nr:hypothetical protein LOTGIDRAFT_154033 [Lottia gigantea]ESO88964.1 hypothetical protein LOTGIDRAFT_154033 [Lottia gigantea]